MKKIILAAVFFLFSFLSYAQDYPFSVTKSGTGKQTLIFIPGFASSGDVWKETVGDLKNEYTCHVFTMAGFAGVAPQEDPTFEKWKAAIAQYIRDEKIIRPILIGHSMGGGLALAIAADYPDLVSKIVVVDALPCLMAVSNPAFKTNPVNDCSGMIDQITNMKEEQFTQMQKRSIASLTTTNSKWDEIVGWGLQSDRKTFAKMFCDFSNTDLRERIKKITVPSLILLEPLFKSIDAIKDQYANLPHAQLKYAGKGLHFIMFDDATWYLNELTQFIREI